MEIRSLSGWAGVPFVSHQNLDFCKQEVKSLTVKPRSLIGYVLAYLTYLPVIRHHNKIRAEDPEKLSPESRLWWLLFRTYSLLLNPILTPSTSQSQEVFLPRTQ